MTELEKSLMNQIDNLYLHYSSKKVVVSEEEAKFIESLNEKIKEYEEKIDNQEDAIILLNSKIGNLENENEELIRKLQAQDFVYKNVTQSLSDALNKSNDIVNSFIGGSHF